MIPELKPDIYRCIVEHLAAIPGPTHKDSTRREIVRSQTDLLSLGKVNRVSSKLPSAMLLLKRKMLYEICAPKLYANCVIGNVTHLLYGLRTRNAMMAKIKRLQIYSGFYYDEPSYVDLFGGLDWSQLITPPSKVRLSNGVTDGSLLEEVALCFRTAGLLEAILRHDPSALAGVRTVSMGDIPNIT